MLLEPLWGNKSFLLLALKIPLCCNKVAIVKHEHLLAEQRIWATLNVRLTWYLSSRVPILVSRGGPNWIGMSGLSLVLIPISGLCGQQKWSCSGLEPLLGNYAITFWHGPRNEPLACPLLRLQDLLLPKTPSFPLALQIAAIRKLMLCYLYKMLIWFIRISFLWGRACFASH